MISGSQCWYLKSPKQTRPYPQNGLTPILIAPPHTYARITHPRQLLVLWNKAKPMLLTYQEETKQPRRPITGLPAPWVLSSAGKLIRYLHGSYLPYRNTVSTPDVSTATWQIPDSKLLLRCIYDILTQISNDFQWSLCHVQCSCCGTPSSVHTVSLLLFHRCFPLLFFIRHLYLSVVARLG